MSEQSSVTPFKKDLSLEERKRLFQRVSSLQRPLFQNLVYILKPPSHIMPDDSAPPATLSKTLLDWAENHESCGLEKLQMVLDDITKSGTNNESYSKIAEQRIAFAISGHINIKTKSELRAFVKLLRQKTGDDSIDIAFFEEGSIRLVLSGSEEGLQKILDLFNSRELVRDSEGRPIEDVYIVDENAKDISSKADLIQELNLRPHDLDSSIDLFGVDLSGANLNQANLRYLNLRSVDLSYADLSYADLSYADLSYANLSNADLSHANLSHSNLSYVDMNGANIDGANLDDVIHSSLEVQKKVTSRSGIKSSTELSQNETEFSPENSETNLDKTKQTKVTLMGKGATATQKVSTNILGPVYFKMTDLRVAGQAKEPAFPSQIAPAQPPYIVASNEYVEVSLDIKFNNTPLTRLLLCLGLKVEADFSFEDIGGKAGVTDVSVVLPKTEKDRFEYTLTWKGTPDSIGLGKGLYGIAAIASVMAADHPCSQEVLGYGYIAARLLQVYSA